MQDLDIGLVVLNAGVANDGRFEFNDSIKLQAMLDANSYQVGAFINAFLPRFEKRQSKSGMIVVSSLAGTFVQPGNFCYSASKAFGRYLCSAVNEELKNKPGPKKVDLLCMYPSFVKTKMIKHLATPANAITVEKSVETGLRDLGQEDETYGALIHEVTGFLVIFFDKYFNELQQKVVRQLVKKGPPRKANA